MVKKHVTATVLSLTLSNIKTTILLYVMPYSLAGVFIFRVRYMKKRGQSCSENVAFSYQIKQSDILRGRGFYMSARRDPFYGTVVWPLHL